MKNLGSTLVDLPSGKYNRFLPLEFLCLNIWSLKRGPSRSACFRVRQWKASLSKLIINANSKVPEPGGSLLSSEARETIKDMTI